MPGLASRRRRAPPLLLLALVLAGGARGEGEALACASCGCGDSTLTATGVEKPYANRVRLALEERFGVHESGEGAGYEQAWTLRSSLSALWSPLDRLTIMGVVPLQSSWLVFPGQPTRSFTGLGDVELSLRGVIWRDRAFASRHLVSLVGGLKFPTGPRLTDDRAYPYPEDDQPGTGSFDPFAGASYAWFGSTLSSYASVSWRQTTPGRRSWQRGSQLGATVGAQLQPTGRIALGLSLDTRWALADSMPDPATTEGRVDVPNTGGVSLALTPSVLVSILEPWLLRVAVQIHVWDHWYGVQNESVVLLLSTAVDLN